ncbi:hypothetical protein AAZX31_10G044600 [Glycine max]
MCLCLSSTVLWISTLIEAQLVSCWFFASPLVTQKQ